MLKAVIVDDEKPSIDILKFFLQKTGKVKVACTFQNPKKALEEIEKINPDVVFLDVEMNGMSGIEIASNISLMDKNIEIVFVTAYDKYALQAFNVNALAYMLKPVMEKDIDKTIKRLMKVCKGLSARSEVKPQVKIQCFGEFEVYSSSNNQPLKWRTSKSKELMAYFFQNRGIPISKWKLCEVLWPEGNQDKIDINLHTTIYKMKKTLRDSNIDVDIKFINKSYIMNINNIYSDVDEFELLIDNKININDDNLKNYEKAFSLYNNYLEENDYYWSLEVKEDYLQKFIKISKDLADFYIEKDNYDAAERVLKRGLEMSPLEEDLHETLLYIYVSTEDRVSFIQHYNSLMELFAQELGIEPRTTLKGLYKKMMSNCG
ncbi:response regulator [Clostridium pasteurianum]|uniref:response regulator n=1 Tax=Clostridium pasteurianum TaxID=1501 RepID=UPI002260B8CC|nr:response regulator [Clostridium pasteurianum]UZW14933.1 response regulator [Clostridium pasteurianum]